MYLINQLMFIRTYVRNRLVPSDICFSIQVFTFLYFCNSINTALGRKQLALLQAQERYCSISYASLILSITGQFPLTLMQSLFELTSWSILVRKPFLMKILLSLRQSNFCDDFNIIDEELSGTKYVFSLQLQRLYL